MHKPIHKSIGLACLILLGFALLSFRVVLGFSGFTPADQPVGYVAQDEVTNYNLTSGQEILFRGQYEREFWSGALFAYPIDAVGNVGAAARWWDAADEMDRQNFDTARFIATMKDNGSAVAFRFANLSAAQQSALGSTLIVNYLRGDRTGEGSTYRSRAHVLGDIIHSRPYFVSDSANPTVFVGANDGMLHAIDASTGATGGQERWAYVPSMLIPKLRQLSVSPYAHDYFVDGQIQVGSLTSAGNKRVLVGALGGGGKGLYALDITGSNGLAAANEAAVVSKVMWEITPAQVNYAAPATANAYVNLGYTYGTPTIAKVSGADRLIVGNGYNDNAGGDYQAYLFVIDPYTGQRVSAIKAGTSGTAASPNGLFTPVAVDSNRDGSVDLVYAGDLNGTLWKFNLGAGTATALLVTSPAQPITGTPGVALHPSGGFMVTFGTGSMLRASDATDSSVHYVYGVWDGAVGAGTLTQTLTERNFVHNGLTTRVRRVTSNQPDWALHKGWKVALPAGERVVGEGSFIENGRFYFTGYNPTVNTTVPGTTTVVAGDSWLMELDYLSGGSKNLPFLDLSGDVKLDNTDRIKYAAGDAVPAGSAIGDPILSTDGVAVGKFLSIGLLSQPILVQLLTLNDTLFNQNPDITIPVVTMGQGVDGGHFDQDMYYGAPTAAGAAKATITVNSTGSSRAATLGGISVNGVSILPALTTADLTNGTLTTANASSVGAKIAGGFTATVAGNVITVTAPAGSAYNGKTLSITAGTSSAGSAGTAPTAGSLVITDVVKNKSDVSVVCGSTLVTGAPGNLASLNDNALDKRLDDMYTKIHGKTVNGYATNCTKTVTSGKTSRLNCAISAPVAPSACSAGFTLKQFVASGNTGPSGGAAPTGWDNFAPALVASAFSGGTDAGFGDACAKCSSQKHIHQYDDIYDVTGVNFLNPSNAVMNLSNAIVSPATQFKVLVQNQYLNPAVKLHIGNPAYQFDVDAGYISIRNYVTSAALDLATLPTYVLSASATAPVLPIGSLAINMPVDALSARNWWGNGDVRVGLHPTQTGCVKSSASTTDGNMYQPVVPPANGTDGPGLPGWSASTTPATASGVRHNGALVVQVISASTPNSAIEQSVSGRPEYGWRVKSAFFATYVIAEMTTFWHHPNGKCYDDAGWTKTPGPDSGSSALSGKAAGSTDPKIGSLGAGGAATGSGTITSTTTTVVGNVSTTVILYSGGLTATVVRTANADGSLTIVTTDTSGLVTTHIVANTSGSVKSGGDERGLQARTGRISWRELIAP